MSDEQPKRKATSGTRHGNGSSIWGDKKGPGSGKPKTDFGSRTNSQGHSKATPAPLNRAEMRRQREDEVEAHLYHLALHADEQRDQIAAGKCSWWPVSRLRGPMVARFRLSTRGPTN
jgi:hypothetical protein